MTEDKAALVGEPVRGSRPKRATGLRSSRGVRGSRRSFVQRSAIVAGLPFLVMLGLRLAVLGGPPFTDGGSWVAHAQLAAFGDGMLPTAPINLYATIASWLGIDPTAPFLRPRLLDAFVAAVGAALLALFLQRWCRPLPALVSTLAWVIVTACPLFIDAGFKNPITASTTVYLLALLWLTKRGRSSAFGAGPVVVFAVLLRESFVLMPVATLLLAWGLSGLRGMLQHVMGLALGGAVVLVGLWLVHAPPTEILAAFGDTAKMNAGLMATADIDPVAQRWSTLRRAMDVAGWLPIAAGLGMVSVLWYRQRNWLASALPFALLIPALPTILGLMCLPYRWANLAMGLALLTALGLDRATVLARLCRRRWLTPVFWAIPLSALLAMSGPLVASYTAGWRFSRSYWPVMVRGDWTSPVVQQSFYLAAAGYLRQHSTVGDSLIVSGFNHTIYPLADRWPPSARLIDLTFSELVGHIESYPERIVALRESPPEFVFETYRWPVPLREFWPEFDARYEVAQEFPVNPRQHYGRFGGRLWRRR